MKKKFFSFVIAFAFILTGAVCLTACGDDPKYYYTTDIQEHCTIGFTSQASDYKGYYVMDGDELDLYINVEDGYYSNNFKLLVNSTELTPTETYKYGETDYVNSYHYSFTPTESFEIKTSGDFTKIKGQLTLSRNESYAVNNADDNKLFIRFEQNTFGLPTTGTNYYEFVKNRLNVNFIKEMSYGDKLEFDIYYNGETFLGAPYVAVTNDTGLSSELYHENGEVGFHYSYTQHLSNTNIEFYNYTEQKIIHIMTGPMSSTQGNIESSKLDITIQDGQLVTITLKEFANIPAEVLNGLRLVINGKNQNIDFTDTSSNGIFTVTLQNPWDYDNSLEYSSYEIDLNFYEFDYFDGIVDLPPVGPIE